MAALFRLFYNKKSFIKAIGGNVVPLVLRASNGHAAFPAAFARRNAPVLPEPARQEWKQKSSFMSPRLEEIVVFAIAAILVALFAWIYARDPQKTTRLWMLGWIAVLVHFAAPALDNFFPVLMSFTWWLKGPP